MRIRWMTMFIDLAGAQFDDGLAFWTEVTGSGLSAGRETSGEPSPVLLPAWGDPYLQARQFRPGSSQLDLHLDPNDQTLDDAVTDATVLGARVIHRNKEIALLTSPGGLPFRLVPWDGSVTVPPPVELAAGGAARLDQLSLDIPPEEFESESRFWSALTGWERRAGLRSEFASLLRPQGMPIRLLFQRRDVAGAGAKVTSHHDFAASDVTRLAQRHVDSGAQIVDRFPHWTTLVDPIGRPYCLTSRNPVTGQL